MADNIVSLASLYFEPLWVFYRGDQIINRLTGFSGQRIAVGEEGSGTRAVALTLLEDNRFDAASAGRTHGHHTSSAMLSLKKLHFLASDNDIALLITEVVPDIRSRLEQNKYHKSST